MNPRFIINSVLLGVGLAMDAFSVSIVNGLREPGMRRARMLMIAGTYAFFQFAMPLTGWFLVHTAAQQFAAFDRAVPWIALILLTVIGGKMIMESLEEKKSQERTPAENSSAAGSDTAGAVSAGTLLLQGIATSIDALSVGFTIVHYGWGMALAASLIIAAVTLLLCLAALRLGRFWGRRLAGRASVLGGVILIAIGIEICVSHYL